MRRLTFRPPCLRPFAAATFAALLLLTACGFGAPPGPTEEEKAAYAEKLAAWQQEREEGLESPDGWLTLTGLDWLREGENRVGSAPDSEVVLPPTTPTRVGVLRLEDGSVVFQALPRVEVTHEGEPVRLLTLESDAEGEPTELEVGPVSFFVIARGDRLGVRVRDRESPALESFEGLEYYPADLAWRLEARFEPYDPPKPIPIANVLGMVEEKPSEGAMVFEVEGKTHRLDVLPGDKETYFVIFADATNGHSTYGAGRYLYPPKPGPDGTTVLDFNKAYNPPCAFTRFATCPLPPPQNHLPFAIEAGEKSYGEH